MENQNECPPKLTELSYNDKQRLRAASFRATRTLPPGIAQFLQDELSAWCDFGYRFGEQGVLERVVQELFQLPYRKVPTVLPESASGDGGTGS